MNSGKSIGIRIVANQLELGYYIFAICYIKNVIYRVLHERSNITAPFAEHLKFQEKMTFTISF